LIGKLFEGGKGKEGRKGTNIALLVTHWKGECYTFEALAFLVQAKKNSKFCRKDRLYHGGGREGKKKKKEKRAAMSRCQGEKKGGFVQV